MNPFNERLKKLRLAAGLTQEALARNAGISVSTVSKLEQHDIDPAWSTVRLLAKGLGVTVLAFAEGEDPPAKGAADEKPQRPQARPKKAK